MVCCLACSKFNRIREIDFEIVVVAEPGVTNLAVNGAVAGAGFYYAPDPSSQIACTIGAMWRKFRWRAPPNTG
jgi:glycolate oxidase